ncbi:hypothetical protein [Pleionea sp. CnH1-48]|nr:hypothetical protein [Pleionea sp. CnH1-48]
MDLKITDTSEPSQKVQLVIQLASGANDALGNIGRTQANTM